MRKINADILVRTLFRWLGFLLLTLIFFLPQSENRPQPVFAKPLTAATADVSLGAMTATIGENFSFTVTFANNGADPGYGPFIDLVFPFTGQDGDDGIDYLSASYLGSALEDSVQVFPDDGGGSGCVSHPWLRDATGAHVDVCGSAGDKFVSLRLPFGSYVPGQPPLDITVNAHLSINADLTPDLLIYARGGYMFGETPEDDWCCGDTPYAVPPSSDSSSWPSVPVTPQVFSFTKEYTGPGNTEDETATGPNFIRHYTLAASVAAGQTLSDLEIQDLLPDNVQFIGLNPATTGGYVINSLPSTFEPGGTLSLTYPSASGTISVVVDFYLPELYDQDGDLAYDDPVIDPNTGDDANSDNIAWAEADWTPFDVRDPLTLVSSNPACPTCPPLHNLLDKSIAIQKSVSVVAGTGGGPGADQPAPGAILEYTLTFQVSDYFSFGGITISDTISDGQHVLPASSFVPTLQVEGNSYVLGPGDFHNANYAVDCDYSGATTTPPTECTAVSGGASGTTTLDFNVSGEIVTQSLGAETGNLLGGCVNPSGGLYSPCDPAHLNDGPTQGVIVFRTEMLDQFVDDYPSGDVSVDQGDVFSNNVDITGDILDNTTFIIVGTESDNAAADTVIGREALSKSIYAINDETDPGNWDYDTLGRIRVMPGDKITYQLTYGLLTSDVEEMSFDDYFPLPVFHVGDPDEDGAPGPAWTFSSAGGIPDPGVVGLGPADTFFDYMSSGIGSTGFLTPSTHNTVPTQDPVIAADSTANKIDIYYADYDDTRNLSTTVDLLFSLVVSDDPFADGLFLTNMAHAFEGSTNAGTNSSDAIVQFVLNEPALVTTKGVVYTSNPNAVFDPTQIGPVGVSFLAPGSQPRWTGTINSSGLTANPIDSNLGGADAGDTVTFAIAIENQGNSINGAFDLILQDVLDTDYYQIPGSGLNLQVYYGDRSGPIPYLAVDGSCTVDPAANNDPCGEELFEEGLELIDPIGTGVCSRYDSNAGNNVILITYDLQIRDDVVPGDGINTVSLLNYAGSEGGPNHLPEAQQDDATVSVIAGLEKTLLGTEVISATNGFDEVVIGELVTYRLSAVVPEGTVPNARLADQLDGGLAFVSCDAAVVPNPTASPGISTSLGDFSGVCAATAASGVTNNGHTIIFDLGDLVNSDRDDTTEERIEVTYQVVVLNISGNQGGTLLDNAASFVMDSGSGDVTLATADADDVRVIEPRIVTTKTPSIVSADADDTFTYTITLTNPSGADDTDAFEVQFQDDFPLCPDPADGSAVLDLTLDSQSGPLTFALSEIGGSGNTNGWQLTAAAVDLAPGDVATVDISGRISYCVIPGLSLDNTGTALWTSLDGDVSAARSSHNTSSVERTGADGVGGALNDYASADTASIQITNTANTKYLITTSEDHTGFVNGLDNAAIGEIVRYRIISALPEGTSPNFQFRDLLPPGLIFLDDGTSLVAFVSTSGITSTPYGIIPAIPAFCNQPGSAADATTPVMNPACTLTGNNVEDTQAPDNTPDSFTPGVDPWFNLGTLVNNDTDIDSEYVVIEFNTLVHNSATSQNDAGETLDNSARAYINGSQNGLDTPIVQARIAEPVIGVSKTLVAPTPNDARDAIEYEIVFSNTAAGDAKATAFDLVLTDTFDAYLENLAVSSVVASQGANCLGDGSGATPFTLSQSLVADTLTVNLSCLDPGENVTLHITGNVVDDVPASTIIYNAAVGTATSLPGTNGSTGNATGSDTPGASGSDTGERNGSDTDTGGPDDYYDRADANHQLQAPVVAKYVDPPGEYTIGDEFYYDLVVTLPEGVTPDMVVYDDLPVGLEFVGYTLITTAAAANSRLLEDFDGTLPVPVATAFGGSGGDFMLDFSGDAVTNADTPDNPDDNSFQVRLLVRMLNVIDNQNGDILVNQGELRYSSGTTATGTVDVEVIEPVLTVGKSVDDPTPALGQTITYTLVIGHDLDGIGEDSQTDAFDISLQDTLPAGLKNLSNISASSTGGCASGIDTSASTATELVASVDSIPYQLPAPGCQVTISFEATVSSPPDADTPAVGATITNAADITWTSLSGPVSEERSGDGIPGGLNDYEASGAEDVTVTNADLRVSKDDGVVFYIPGLSVTYTIVVENVGNLGVNNAEVSDDIPPQVDTWDWVCAGTTGGASGCSPVAGSSANFTDLVDLPAGSSLTYQVTANILSSGTGNLVNTVDVAQPAGFIEPTPLDNTDTDSDVQQSHADLSVSKDDGVTVISAGQTLTYTVVVENLSPSDVFNATVEDLIPAEFDSWIWACTGATGGASGCTPAASSALDFNDSIDLPALSSITYTVTAQVSAAASGSLTNTVTVDVPAGVTEDDNTNNSASDTDGIAEGNKALDSLVHGVTTPPDVAIGEILIYEVSLTVPDGSLTHLHLLDTLDQGLAYVSCESIDAPGLTTTIGTGFAGICASPTVDPVPAGSPAAEDQGRSVDFDFGTLGNATGGPVVLTVRYRVVVLDSLANQSTSTPPLNNQAEWIWDSGQITDQAVGVVILEPDLEIAKSVDQKTIYPGQIRTFTLTISHTGESQTPAYEVELTDILPPELVYVPPIRYISGPAPTAIIDAGAPTLVIQWNVFPDTGVPAVFEIDVTLESTIHRIKRNQTITNEATLAWTSLPGDFSAPQSIHNILSTERRYDPFSNVDVYGVTDSTTLRVPALPETGFAPGQVTSLPEQSPEQQYGEMAGLRLEIPKLGVSLPIVSIPQSDQGWDLSWLWNQAGWLEGTAYPSWYGNTVITGHAYLSNGLPGPFVNLGQLSWGDEIVLYANGLKYTYQVRFRDLVAADDFKILGHLDQDWVTLFTCKDYNEYLHGYQWREVVQAVLTAVEEAQ